MSKIQGCIFVEKICKDCIMQIVEYLKISK